MHLETWNAILEALVTSAEAEATCVQQVFTSLTEQIYKTKDLQAEACLTLHYARQDDSMEINLETEAQAFNTLWHEINEQSPTNKAALLFATSAPDEDFTTRFNTYLRKHNLEPITGIPTPITQLCTVSLEINTETRN